MMELSYRKSGMRSLLPSLKFCRKRAGWMHIAMLLDFCSTCKLL